MADKKAKGTKATPTAEKSPYTPTANEKGRLDHSTCGHPRTPKDRAACRAELAKASK